MLRLIALTSLTLLSLPLRAESVRTLTLHEAIDRAAGASPQRAMAQADLDASVARRKEAMTGMGPHLRADYTDARYDREVDVAFGPDSFTLRPETYRGGALSLSQPLTGIYTAHEAADAARAREEARSLNLEMAKADASFRVADAYLAAQESDELVRIAKSSLLATESQRKDAEALTQSGRLIRSDFLKIGIAQQDAKAQVARAQAEQKKAHDRLGYLVGMNPGEAFALDPLTVAELGKFTAPAREAALEQANNQRLELKHAASEVKAAAQNEHVVRLRYLPNVDVFVKWERIYSEPPFGNPPFTRSIGVAASWDIWDNGARSFAHDEAAAETRKATTALQESKDHVRLEIDDLLADLTAAKEAYAAAQAAVEQAEEAYRLDKARFGSGLVTATDLLISEATSTKAQGNRVASLVTLDRLMLALQRATGAVRPEPAAL